jgi:hypothetical protein
VANELSRQQALTLRAVVCRDLVINNVLMRVAHARVLRDLARRTNTLSKQPGPYRFVFEGEECTYRCPRLVAVMHAFEEVATQPEAGRHVVDPESVSIGMAMVRLRKIVLAGAAQRALRRSKHALTSVKQARWLLELPIECENASVEDISVLALVADVLVAHIDHFSLDEKTHKRLLGVSKVRTTKAVVARLSDESTLADLEKLFHETLDTVVVALIASRRPEIADQLELADSQLLHARDTADDVRRYRAAIARGRQPSRQRL